MTGVIVIMAVVLFLTGVAIGVFTAVAVAVRREDRRYPYPLTGAGPTRLAKYARYLNGLSRPNPDGELFPSHGDLRRY
jgi:hypothetical protein